MKIHHTAITVSNMEESISFYQKFFGLTIKKEFESQKLNARFVMMSDGKEGIIELIEFHESQQIPVGFEELPAEGIKHIAFLTENLNEMKEKFEDAGYKPEISEGLSARLFFIKDPTGVSIELYEPL